MKHFIKAFSAIMILISLAACSKKDNEHVIPYKKLPANAINLIETHFPDAKTISIKKDADDPNEVYDVKLDNGFDIDFDKEGNWTEIDGHGQKVPDRLIPDPILTYVQTNYPDAFIEEIDRKHNGFKVDLSNDIDLIFDQNGDFLRTEH